MTNHKKLALYRRRIRSTHFSASNTIGQAILFLGLVQVLALGMLCYLIHGLRLKMNESLTASNSVSKSVAGTNLDFRVQNMIHSRPGVARLASRIRPRNVPGNIQL